MQRDVLKLWIEHKEILGKQPTVSNEAAALARNACVAVQEIGELADVAVGDKGSRVRVRAQGCGSRDRRAVDLSRSEIESVQHLIKQESVAARPRGLEGLEESVIENLH